MVTASSVGSPHDVHTLENSEAHDMSAPRSFLTRATPLGIALALAVLHACAGGSDEAGTEPTAESTGRLVIVGGALQADNEAVYRAVLDGRQGEGPICVVPTASGEPAASMRSAVERLDVHGGPATARGILLSTENPEQAQDPAVADELASCAGYFFTGGSQSRIVDVFLPDGDTTAAYRAVRRRWEEGAVVAGTSAGAAMMSRSMISGGSSEEAVEVGVADGPDADGVQLRPGMAFFEPMLDQHFLARGRIGRLLVAVSQPELPDVGIGIDENTALVVDGESAVVVGASGVVVVDGRAAERRTPTGATGLRVTLAGRGDVLDLRTYSVRQAADKMPLTADGAAPEPPADPFARWAFLHLIADLAASSAAEVTVEGTVTTLRIAKPSGFAASVIAAAGGVEGTPLGLSAGPFVVDLVAPGM